mmetsp:Transcript_22163/g.43961  ORF Transcript_22163/g.43961 Transcript_22163/m.43961 type:complete len:88 (-) Transcript_22163:64-327(-)
MAELSRSSLPLLTDCDRVSRVSPPPHLSCLQYAEGVFSPVVITSSVRTALRRGILEWSGSRGEAPVTLDVGPPPDTIDPPPVLFNSR